MKILILCQEPPFDAGQVTTGNALRTRQLHEALGAAGHEVHQAWLDRETGEHRFRSADELRELLQRERPEVVLVSYWELLGLLPFDLELPVVLDFLAPRPLEGLFEDPARVGGMLRRLRVALARADLVLVGNERQRDLLAYWLLEAGFDLRETDPVRVVPLAGNAVQTGDRPDPAKVLRLVAGGVKWPWRLDHAYQRALDDTIAVLRAEGHAIELHRLGGAYRWAEAQAASQRREDTGAEAVSRAGAEEPLRSYRAWSELLCRAHIGIELGADHVERRFSQSFRSVDFLRHGLPLLCSDNQPLTEGVRTHRAGWVVDRPEAVEAVLRDLVSNPDQWHAAHAGALELLAAAHEPQRAIQPLLAWLEDAAKAPRLPGYGLPDPTPPVLGVPPWPERLGRRYRLARRIALHRLLAPAPDTQREAIVMVSRPDLFPTDHGAAVKIIETARGMSRHGRDVYLVTHDRRRYWRVRDGAVEALVLPRWLSLLARPEPWVKLEHYTQDLPESDAFLYLPLSDGSFFRRVLWVAAQHAAGALQAEFPAYALPCLQVGEILDIPTLLVEHNVEYHRLDEQIAALTPDQLDRFRAIEIDLCNRVAGVVCVSDNDRQRLAADGVHPGKLHTIPHGIDLEAFDRAAPAPARTRFAIPEETPLLVYHGTFAYPPNRDALNQLATEVLPRLERRGIEAHVLAVGHKPPERSPHPSIHCTGSVASVAPWLKAADIAVVPLREGGGTRMKIIDDFAAGLPVVATPKGIEGIPAVDGQHALIREDWDDFADAVASLIEDEALRSSLASTGRALAETLDWTAIGGRYLELLDRLAR
jgi:glycosyltransferase involved in cell wall biosynthesis